MNTKIVYSCKGLELTLKGWSTLHDMDAEELILLHIEEMFGLSEVQVVNIVNNDEFLTLTLKNRKWKGPKEFSLLDNGSLATDF